MSGLRPQGRLAASARIRKRHEFRAVQAGQERVTTRHFVVLLRARPKGSGSQARLGITASRRVGCAVVRSRAKRLVREAFRTLREQWGSDLDVVVIVRYLEPEMKLGDVIGEWVAADRTMQRQIEHARRRVLTASPCASDSSDEPGRGK